MSSTTGCTSRSEETPYTSVAHELWGSRCIIFSLPCIVLWIIIPCKVCFLADFYHIIDYKNKAKILPLLIHCLDWNIDNRSFNAKLNTYLDKECKDGETIWFISRLGKTFIFTAVVMHQM